MKDLLDRLKKNKGTLSSEFGKELASAVLAGDKALLGQILDFCLFELGDKKGKNVRSGAAKAVELVAMEKPALVAPRLEGLLPALEDEEPQTRWMIFRALGCCAKLKPEVAKKALPFAKQCIREKKEGQLCLLAAVDLYLGDYGATSKEAAQEAYKLLLESCDRVIQNEHDWILEGLIKIVPDLPKKQKAEAAGFAGDYAEHRRKKTRERVAELLAVCGDV